MEYVYRSKYERCVDCKLALAMCQGIVIRLRYFQKSTPSVQHTSSNDIS